LGALLAGLGNLHLKIVRLARRRLDAEAGGFEGRLRGRRRGGGEQQEEDEAEVFHGARCSRRGRARQGTHGRSTAPASDRTAGRSGPWRGGSARVVNQAAGGLRPRVWRQLSPRSTASADASSRSGTSKPFSAAQTPAQARPTAQGL